MDRHHIPFVVIAYTVATLLTAVAAFEPGFELVGFVILSAFVGGLLLLAALSHSDWKDARQRRRKARDDRLRRAALRTEPKPFCDRLNRFATRRETLETTDAEAFRSGMSCQSGIDLDHVIPTQPKSADFIREMLLQIRNILRGSHACGSQDSLSQETCKAKQESITVG